MADKKDKGGKQRKPGARAPQHSKEEEGGKENMDVNKPKQGFTPTQQLERLTKRGDVGQKLFDELEYIHGMCPKFDRFLDPSNARRNRYANLICYDHSRFILQDDWSKTHGDYIHASVVDGYDRPGQYILAQAPFNEMTEFDFWRMVWLDSPTVIVVLNPIGGDMKKNGMIEFWPTQKGTHKTYCDGSLLVRNEKVQAGTDCDLHDLSLVKAGESTSFFVRMLHVTCWDSDDDVPANLVSLQAKARMAAYQVEQQANRGDCPMLLVCSSGVHRSGTFCALDISIKRMQDSRRVALKQTVEQLRYERYGVMQRLNHYLYMVEAIVGVSIQAAYVHPDDAGEEVIMFKLRKTAAEIEKEKQQHPEEEKK